MSRQELHEALTEQLYLRGVVFDSQLRRSSSTNELGEELHETEFELPDSEAVLLRTSKKVANVWMEELSITLVLRFEEIPMPTHSGVFGADVSSQRGRDVSRIEESASPSPRMLSTGSRVFDTESVSPSPTRPDTGSGRLDMEDTDSFLVGMMGSRNRSGELNRAPLARMPSPERQRPPAETWEGMSFVAPELSKNGTSNPFEGHLLGSHAKPGAPDYQYPTPFLERLEELDRRPAQVVTASATPDLGSPVKTEVLSWWNATGATPGKNTKSRDDLEFLPPARRGADKDDNSAQDTDDITGGKENLHVDPFLQGPARRRGCNMSPEIKAPRQTSSLHMEVPSRFDAARAPGTETDLTDLCDCSALDDLVGKNGAKAMGKSVGSLHRAHRQCETDCSLQ